MPLVSIENLTLDFVDGSRALRALDGVSISIETGETLCLVGESGSGKSLTALSIVRLVPSPPAMYPAGRILLDGREVLRLSKNELRALRGRVVSYVFQDPGASLNPVLRVGAQIMESLRLHRPNVATDAEVARLLSLVGIPDATRRARDYPHQLSGGMQQRMMIAMAIASEPKLLVADEPTTALDVTIQAQILELLGDLKRRLGMAILLITHNLAMVRGLADRIAVMYAGQIVEHAPAEALLREPLHPYTRALMRSAPELGEDVARLSAIAGTVPQLDALPTGCRFHPRCKRAQPDCSATVPELREVLSGRWVRCPYWNRPELERSSVEA